MVAEIARNEFYIIGYNLGLTICVYLFLAQEIDYLRPAAVRSCTGANRVNTAIPSE